MKLTYLGHSCFLIVFNSGLRVVTDPYDGIGYALPHVEADVVTVSHAHFDHAACEKVQGSFRVLNTAGSREEGGGVTITAFESWHDSVHGAMRGANLVFRFEENGFSLCHLGDLGEPLSSPLVRSLLPVDVLLLPVGGVYTIDAAEAKAYTQSIAPAAAVPMHFQTADLNFRLGGAEAYLKLFPKGQIERVGSSISLSRERFPAGNPTKIIVMERYKV